MSKTIITKKELTVPVEVILEVSELIMENQIINTILGADTDNDEIILEIQYEKDERDVILEIEDVITTFYESDHADK